MATDGGPGNDLKMLISPTYFSLKPHFLNVLEPPQAELTGKPTGKISDSYFLSFNCLHHITDPATHVLH